MLLTELIASASQHLLNHGYTKLTISHCYVCHWNKFSKTLHSNVEYDNDLLVNYITQQNGNNLLLLSPEKMSRREYIRYKAFRALDSFYKTGTILGTSMSESVVRQSLSQGSNAVLNSFMKHLEKLGFKPTSKKDYYVVVHSFLYSCPFETMNSDQIINYLLGFGSKAKETAKNTQKVLKRFFLFIYQNELIDQDFSSLIISTKKRKNTEIPSVYTPEEIKLLLNYLKGHGNNCLRNYAIAVLFAVYGYRSCDISTLELSNIDWDNNLIRIEQGKTSVELNHKLTDFCGNALADYLLNERPSTTSNLVFISTNGKPLNPSAISSMISQGFIYSGVIINGRKHACHSLRHSLASNMLEQGANILDISHTLGHTSIRSTMIYAKIDIPHLRMCELEVPDYGK